MSSQPSAPLITARSAIVRTAPISCSRVRLTRGSGTLDRTATRRAGDIPPLRTHAAKRPNLMRLPCPSGERRRPGIQHVLDDGADVLVRYRLDGVELRDTHGEVL